MIASPHLKRTIAIAAVISTTALMATTMDIYDTAKKQTNIDIPLTVRTVHKYESISIENETLIPKITEEIIPEVIEPELDDIYPEFSINDLEKVLPPSQRDKNRVPDGNTNFMPCEPYTTITDKKSEQYALQLECYTDEIGARRYHDSNTGKTYYTVALGSAYGRTIGDTFHVTLACGSEFDIMFADFKDDGSTDLFGLTHDTQGNRLLNYDKKPYIGVLEFIGDINKLHPEIKRKGTFTVLDQFGGLHGNGGNITSITNTGVVWRPSAKK